MKKIKCLNPVAQVGTALLPEQYEITECLEEADAVLVRSASMHQLELPPTVEAVARAGAGVNNIPLEEYAKKGIVVFNTPGANANGVKELVLCGLLLAARDVAGGIAWVKEHSQDTDLSKEVEKVKKQFAGGEIQGKNLGVIGLGAIGVLVANAASSLGMNVYGYDPYLSINAAWLLSRNITHIEKLSDLYGVCDYLTVHVPLTQDTKGMIGKQAFSQMKDGTVLLNFSRDQLVDEKALAEAMETGRIKTYVTDFPNPAVASLPGVLAIPHLGASTEESEDNCAVMAVRELLDYLENGNINNSVNFPSCSLGPKKGHRIALFHHNVQNMIGQIASILAAEGINIGGMANQSRKDLAYTLIDLDGAVSPQGKEKLLAIDGVFKLREI